MVTAVEMRTYWWTRIQPGWQSNMGILILQKVDAVSCQETVQFVPSALSGVEMTRDNRRACYQDVLVDDAMTYDIRPIVASCSFLKTGDCSIIIGRWPKRERRSERGLPATGNQYFDRSARVRSLYWRTEFICTKSSCTPNITALPTWRIYDLQEMGWKYTMGERCQTMG